jgi:hypothetical protein
MRPAVTSDGSKYYQLILIHTDDILAISETAMDTLTKLDQHYMLKKGSIGQPRTYLGAAIGRFSLPNNPTMTSRRYLGLEKYAKE